MNIQAALREIERQWFLMEHLHLMCPGLFTARERTRRDAILLRRQWDKAPA